MQSPKKLAPAANIIVVSTMDIPEFKQQQLCLEVP